MRLIFSLLILLVGCQIQRQSENYDIQASDIQLRQDSHPHGWTRSDCFACHIPANIHQVNRLNHPSFALAKNLVEQYGVGSCYACHGRNGVAP